MVADYKVKVADLDISDKIRTLILQQISHPPKRIMNFLRHILQPVTRVLTVLIRMSNFLLGRQVIGYAQRETRRMAIVAAAQHDMGRKWRRIKPIFAEGAVCCCASQDEP
jgi:hypothetical protein